MTGINVLSTGVASKSKDEGFSGTEKVQSGSDLTLDFAAIFTGWITQLSGQGQNSEFQSNEPAGKEANSGQKATLGLDELQVLIGTIQGLGNPKDVPTEAAQEKQPQMPMTWVKGQRGEAPAEENPVEVVLAQLNNLQHRAAPSNLMGNMEEVNRSGMTTEPPPEKTSPKSELDLYKGVISELLKEMSGEIQDKTQIRPETLNGSAQVKLELIAQRINSGLFTDFTSGTQSQAMSQSGKNSILSRASIPVENVPLPQEQGLHSKDILVKMADLDTDSVSDSDSDSVLLSARRELPTADYKTTAQIVKDQSGTLENNSGSRHFGQENLGGTVLQEQESVQIRPLVNEAGGPMEISTLEELKVQPQSKVETLPKKPLIETLSEEIVSEEALIEKEALKRSSFDEAHTQDSGIKDVGILSQTKETVQILNKTSNKTDLPIWAQVARDIHEKTFQSRPHIRELDIQLHPAELGQIRLSLTWDDGQVHLRMTASELGTGQMLQANLSELRDNLTQLGIQCGQLQMELGDQQKNPRERGQETSPKPRGNREESQEILGSLGIEALIGSQGLGSKEASNRINVTA